MDTRKIIYYKLNGDLEREEKLNEETLKNINGMMTRCHLSDNSEIIGLADVFRLHDGGFDQKIHDYIYSVTWDNLDEESHQLTGDGQSKYSQTFTLVNIDKILYIEAILYSNPRFGTKLTNLFSI